MTAKKKATYIWTSYSDLMTSLFFVMLVLFVLVVAMLHQKIVETEEEKKATQAELNKIKELNESIKRIDTMYFEYNEEFKRHTLKDIKVSFRRGSSDFGDIPTMEKLKLRRAGESIRDFMIAAKKNSLKAEYMLIVEGQSSKDGYNRNYELSYERALALVKYWSACGIVFDGLPCEVIISGSGQTSRFRESPDVSTNEKNQRFVIHIIPKPGKIK